MFEEYENKKKKQIIRMRSIKDYGMGALILLLGLFFLFHNVLKLSVSDGETSTMEKVFGGMCLIYGGWRIYRGYKKNYFG